MAMLGIAAPCTAAAAPVLAQGGGSLLTPGTFLTPATLASDPPEQTEPRAHSQVDRLPLALEDLRDMLRDLVEDDDFVTELHARYLDKYRPS